jgi:hypothetical protein
MATLETQYKNFKSENPNSNFTFDQWFDWHGDQLIEAMKKIN